MTSTMTMSETSPTHSDISELLHQTQARCSYNTDARTCATKASQTAKAEPHLMSSVNRNISPLPSPERSKATTTGLSRDPAMTSRPSRARRSAGASWCAGTTASVSTYGMQVSVCSHLLLSVTTSAITYLGVYSSESVPCPRCGLIVGKQHHHHGQRVSAELLESFITAPRLQPRTDFHYPGARFLLLRSGGGSSSGKAWWP